MVKAIRIEHTPDLDIMRMRQTEEFKRAAAEFEREMMESRAAYIERNGITPEEAYQANYYPYHAFGDFD